MGVGVGLNEVKEENNLFRLSFVINVNASHLSRVFIGYIYKKRVVAEKNRY